MKKKKKGLEEAKRENDFGTKRCTQKKERTCQKMVSPLSTPNSIGTQHVHSL